MKNEYLQSLTKDELIQLIEDYSKNWLAMDGARRTSLWKTKGRRWSTGQGNAACKRQENANRCLFTLASP